LYSIKKSASPSMPKYYGLGSIKLEVMTPRNAKPVESIPFGVLQ
jgi:hypothetical protein